MSKSELGTPPEKWKDLGTPFLHDSGGEGSWGVSRRRRASKYREQQVPKP